jgi:hypothetical protein
MSQNARQSPIPTRVLGSTGERASVIGLGGWHLALSHVDERLAIRIVNVDHFVTQWMSTVGVCSAREPFDRSGCQTYI